MSGINDRHTAILHVNSRMVKEKADLLLTHHPMIFGSIKSVTTDDYVGERLIRLIRGNISYYAMHTNYDVMGAGFAMLFPAPGDRAAILTVLFKSPKTFTFGRWNRFPELTIYTEAVRQPFLVV